MATCRHCGAWHIRPDDVYCARCGKTAIGFDFLDGTQFVPVPDKDEQIDVRVKVRNTGQACADLLIRTQPLSALAGFEGLPLELRIQPGEEDELRFHARFKQPPVSGRHEIGVSSKVPNVSKRICFYSVSAADLQMKFADTRDEITIVRDEKLESAIELFNGGGCSVKVTWEELPPWLNVAAPDAVVYPFSSVFAPCTIDPDKADDDTFMGTVRATLAKWENTAFTVYGDKSIETPVFVRVNGPNPLILWERGDKLVEIGDEINLGRLVPWERRRERFLLRNAGGIELPVTALYSRFAHDDPALIASFDYAVGPIPAGEERGFHLCIDASLHREGPPRPHPIMLDFGPSGQKEIRVVFEVARMRPYGGILAIDFGTSYSCIAKCGSVTSPAEVIRPPSQMAEVGTGGRPAPYVPSVLYFFSPEDYLFGHEAKEFWARADPGNSVANIKRALTGKGRVIRERQFSPDELVRIMMRELVTAASRDLDRLPTELIATVPVSFSEQQRSVIRRALLEDHCFFGNRSVTVIDEPTAAAMHYYFTHMDEFRGASNGKPKRLLVFDFGGGTLDVSVLTLTEEGLDILARRGDPQLGGIDLDRTVAIEMAERILSRYPAFELQAIALGRHEFEARFGNRTEMLRMRITFAEKSEKTKIALSRGGAEGYEIPAAELLDINGIFLSLEGGAKDFKDTFTQEDFVKIISDRIERSLNVLDNALKAASLSRNDIDLVLLTGQVCKTECLRKRVKEYFKGTRARFPDHEKDKFDVKSCVAMGAARFAQALRGGSLRGRHVAAGVGRYGYFVWEKHELRFITVLSENHEFGEEGKTPVQLCLNSEGESRCEIFQNFGDGDVMRETNDPDFYRVGVVRVVRRDLANKEAELYIGLDENGNLTARMEGTRLPVEFVPAESDEVW